MFSSTLFLFTSLHKKLIDVQTNSISPLRASASASASASAPAPAPASASASAYAYASASVSVSVYLELCFKTRDIESRNHSLQLRGGDS